MDVARTLARTAEKLAEKARKGQLSVDDLNARVPWLCQQILRDAETTGLFDLWTDSSNFDELANVSIVEPGILNAIGDLARLPLASLIVHAGLQHTYGYLLSTIKTRFGYKRDRWVSPMLEAGFGLPSDTLGPNPSEGTLLCNATLFAGKIAFRGDEASLRKIRGIAPAAAQAVRTIVPRRFEHKRIIETVPIRDSAGRFGSIRIQTDLVPFPNLVEGCTENTLLVYSISNSSHSGARLTTLFPIAPAFLAELLHPDRFGNKVEIRSRFNAHVPEFAGKPVIGRRTMISF